MKYVIIENWENLSSPQLCTNEDGETIVFDSLEKAKIEANSCQEGIVVPLCTKLINLIEEAVAFIDTARYILDENSDEENNPIENELLGLLN